MRRNFKISSRSRRLSYLGRKSAIGVLVVAVLALLVSADRMGCFGRADIPDREKYDGKEFRVVHVVDGDTIDIDIPDGPHKSTRIRLWGVDTPETVRPDTPPQHYGPQASQFTKDTVQGKIVRIELEPQRNTRDKYNRLLGYVRLSDGRLLNAILIEQGYGYADPRFDHKRKAEFARLQSAARKGRLGLWKDLKQEDLPDYLRGKIALPGN